MAVSSQVRFQFRAARSCVPQRAFDGESQVAAAHMEINQRRAFNSETGNNDRPDPALTVFVRKIDDQLQLLPGNLRDTFPAAGCLVRRLAKRDGSKQDCGE